MERGRTRGFTLIELVVAVVISGAIAITGVTLIGRKVVDDATAVKVMVDAGWSNVKMAERHDAWPASHGCDYGDAVAFLITGTNKGMPDEQTVCCGSWFKGCRVVSKEEDK